MKTRFYLAITGGVGGAKLALGLSNLLSGNELTLIVNTGDDFLHLGLHISPDIDTLVYTLAGESNSDVGWGRRDESWQCMDALATLGGETWFRLGDRDLAMHLERTRRLEAGESLTYATAGLASSLGIDYRILPMSDDPVRTQVLTAGEVMDFQHYFVREGCQPVVTGFTFDGADSASVSPEIEQCLNDPALAGIILCPSNPFVSIDPILAVRGMQQRLMQCPAPVIAVSPVVGGAAIKGPTVKMMQELSIPNTAAWVAGHYRHLLDGFVLDNEDDAFSDEVEALGMKVLVTQTVMETLDDRVKLAQDCLDLIGQLESAT
jgi:LPPG:FO 2-phospho-L-lactate transferase